MAAPVQYSSQPSIRRVLNNYLRHLCQLPSPPCEPIFLPGEMQLAYHYRLMIVPHHSDVALSELYNCALFTQKIGRTWVVEATAAQVPCWVFGAASLPDGDMIWPTELRRMVLEKRDDREGPDPGWGDLAHVLYRETRNKEGAYFVDSVTGAVEGLDT